MNIIWEINDDDINKVKTFYKERKNNKFVLSRID